MDHWQNRDSVPQAKEIWGAKSRLTVHWSFIWPCGTLWGDIGSLHLRDIIFLSPTQARIRVRHRSKAHRTCDCLSVYQLFLKRRCLFPPAFLFCAPRRSASACRFQPHPFRGVSCAVLAVCSQVDVIAKNGNSAYLIQCCGLPPHTYSPDAGHPRTPLFCRSESRSQVFEMDWLVSSGRRSD